MLQLLNKGVEVDRLNGLKMWGLSDKRTEASFYGHISNHVFNTDLIETTYDFNESLWGDNFIMPETRRCVNQALRP